MGDLIDQIFQFLEQLILPNWSNLFLLLPWALIVIVVLGLVWIVWAWSRAGTRNRSRVPKPLAGGDPPPGVHMPGPSRWPFVAPFGFALLLFSIVLPPKDAAGNTIGLFNFWLFVLGLVVTLIAIIGWLRDAGREWRRTDQPQLAGAHGSHGGQVALTAGSNATMALVPSSATTALQRRGGLIPDAALVEPAYPEPPPGVHMPGPSPWPFFIPIAATVLLYGVIFSAVLIVAGIILSIIAVTGWYLDAGHEYFSTEQVGHAVPATRDPYKAWPKRLVPVFIAVIAISVLITLAPIGLTALNGLTPPEATGKPVAVPAVPEIAAEGVKFDRGNLIVPAGRPFDLMFTNNDAGIPHNVEIQTDDKSSTLFEGERVTGVATATYHVPALQPGTYYFLCTVHPPMNGQVTAIAETGAPAAPGASGAPQPGSGAPPAPQASQAP